jgi:hypothetical protein
LAVKAEFPLVESIFQEGYEFGPEQSTEELHGQEKLPAASDPTAAVRSNSTTGNDTMEVGMMMQVLSPSMEHRQKTDPGAQVLGVSGNLQQGLGRGAEEHAVNYSLVLKSQGSDRLGQREDDVKVLNGQKLGGSLLKPRRSGCALALWAMAIAAGTISDRAMSGCRDYRHHDVLRAC